MPSRYGGGCNAHVDLLIPIYRFAARLLASAKREEHVTHKPNRIVWFLCAIRFLFIEGTWTLYLDVGYQPDVTQF
jgi:hypothetical protein